MSFVSDMMANANAWENVRLNQRANRLSSDLDEAYDAHNETIKCLNKWKASHANQKKQIEALKAEVATLKTEVTTQKNEVLSLVEKYNGVVPKYNGLLSTITDLKSKLYDAVTSIKGLKYWFKQAETDRVKCYRVLHHLMIHHKPSQEFLNAPCEWAPGKTNYEALRAGMSPEQVEEGYTEIQNTYEVWDDK